MAKWFVRAKVKNPNPPFELETEMRKVQGDSERGAVDRFTFLIESEGKKVREVLTAVKAP